jgi:hypothetical protein
MIRQLSIAAMLAAAIALPLGWDLSREEPIASPEAKAPLPTPAAAEPSGDDLPPPQTNPTPAPRQAAPPPEPVQISLAQAMRLPAAHRVAGGQPPPASSEGQRGPSAKEVLPDEGKLPELLDLRLRPMNLPPTAQPGQRLGHGDAVLSLPLGERWELRTGVRVDYENRPRDGIWELEGTPTLGIGFRF